MRQLVPPGGCTPASCHTRAPTTTLQVQLEIDNLRAALDEERDAASKAEAAPGRARQAADAAVAALRALREEEADVAAQLRNWEGAEAVATQVVGRLLACAGGCIAKRTWLWLAIRVAAGMLSWNVAAPAAPACKQEVKEVVQEQMAAAKACDKLRNQIAVGGSRGGLQALCSRSTRARGHRASKLLPEH